MQEIGVAAVVLAALCYALWYWMPAPLRRRLGAIRPGLGKSPSCASSCDSCGGCTPASAADRDAGQNVRIVRRR